MRSTRLAVVLLAGVGLSACVRVSDGNYRQPYGTFTGNTHLAAPHSYPSGSRSYLYNQSQRSRPRAFDRQKRGNERNQYDRPGHDNRRNF